MNNKGFTLVEMLATVVILGAVMGIATYNVIGAINKSRERSEKLFVSKLETVIQSYISDNRFNWMTDGDSIGSFDKCRRVNDDGSCYSEEDKQYTNFYTVSGLDILNSSFDIKLLADEKYVQGGKIINPKNKLNCLDNETRPNVFLYKDEDSVFYYYVDLRGDNTSCSINNDNAIISNIPEKMCNVLSEYSWNSTKKVCEK